MMLGSTTEDELLTSSQEDISKATNPATIGNGVQNSITPTTSTTSVEENKVPLTLPKKTKSGTMTMKARYQKALFILNKIERNREAGTVHEFDEADKIKYLMVVDEYEKYLASRPTTEKATKRNHSKEENSQGSRQKHAKISKSAPTENASRRSYHEAALKSSSRSATKRFNHEMMRDGLQMALIDEISGGGGKVLEKWCEIESKLAELVMEHLLNDVQATPPGIDSSEVQRGCRVFKCDDQVSKDFLCECIAALNNRWVGLRLKLVPVGEIPKRPRARIWLPILKLEHAKIFQLLQRQNPHIPINDWSVVKDEGPQKTSMSLLLSIPVESATALGSQECKLRFGVRYAKIKIFKATANEEDELGNANKPIEDFNFQVEDFDVPILTSNRTQRHVFKNATV